jgi:putative transposase
MVFRISMDGKGRCLDNVLVERLWRSVKYEEVYLRAYEDVRIARSKVGRYLRFFNQERPHQTLAYRTPMAVYMESVAKQRRSVLRNFDGALLQPDGCRQTKPSFVHV